MTTREIPRPSWRAIDTPPPARGGPEVPAGAGATGAVGADVIAVGTGSSGEAPSDIPARALAMRALARGEPAGKALIHWLVGLRAGNSSRCVGLDAIAARTSASCIEARGDPDGNALT